MSMRFSWALRSDVGLVRSNNEDCAYARPDLLVLADGMGGHAGGEVASVVTLHAHARAMVDGPRATDAVGAFSAAARTTRTALQAMSDADDSLATMGTTAVAVAVTDAGAWVSHIGDSRAYLLRDGELTQLTTDHTHVQHLVEIGKITPEQVRSHPYRAMLLRSLDDQGGGAAPDIFAIDLEPGDRVLLCSDGLSDYVEVEGIHRAASVREVEDAADALVDIALRRGTRDNVTVVVADAVDADSLDAVSARAGEVVGAATAPLQVSEAAARALREAFPEFDHPIGADGLIPDDLAHTPAPVLNPEGIEAASGLIEPTTAGVPVAAILTGAFVAGISVAIYFLLS